MDFELSPVTDTSIRVQIVPFANQQLAVKVENANRSFGRGKNASRVLKGINMSVPVGCVYGLLGPSGCGKTTLLNAIVGCLSLDSGQVRVFGQKPGSKLSMVPGRGVGYMPQEMALYPEFTIKETLTYFGKLHHLDAKTIKEETNKLMKVLDLPQKSILVEKLSGGQQRRASLAACLIHKPPLLILDEPTVGVDPLLRQTIWSYLVDLTQTDGITIVITTHYIGEASQSNIVGLMRDGQLLTEENPVSLTRRLGEPLLETCFLKLCSGVTESNSEPTLTKLLENDESTNPISVLDEYRNGRLANPDFVQGNELRRQTWVQFVATICTLFYKSMKRFRRNVWLAIVHVVIPPILMTFLCLAVGPMPFNLPVGVVNEENPKDISLQFLSFVDPVIISQIEYSDLDSAIAAAHRGHVFGLIHFGPDFGRSLVKRMEQGIYASADIVNSSTIEARLDMTSLQIAVALQKTLMEAFQNFTWTMLIKGGADPSTGDMPISFQNPIYGNAKVKFTEFVGPAVNLNIGYFLAVALTVMVLVEERKIGCLNRNFVSGVTSSQIVIAQISSQFIILSSQAMGLFIIAFLVFDIPLRGPFILVIFMMLLQGLLGMAVGLLISGVARNESMALMALLGSYYPSIMIGGIFWPIEAQPVFLRYISRSLPQTLPNEAIRAVVSRGWGIHNKLIWSSVLVNSVWILIVLGITIVALKYKK